MSALRLQILVCTYGADGLRRVAAMLLPDLPGLGYVVSCQDPDGTLDGTSDILPQRDDLELYIHADRGLGLNRRHALGHASAEFVLLADDDLCYDRDALDEAMEIMAMHTELDIFAFRYSGPDNKLYPPSRHDLRQSFRGYNLTSFELAFRLSAVRAAGVDFSPLLGVGAPYLKAAEESVFTERCLQSGLKGCFFPLTIVRHPGLTTGLRSAASPGVVRSTAAYIYIKYGLCEGFLRSLLLAWRTPVAYFRALVYVFQGMAYAVRHRKEL